ncbi:MAG: hypothetical protein K2N30_00900 [Clostridia bacterium]|nr:hypothetical protein [Clostridia bacterium]
MKKSTIYGRISYNQYKFVDIFLFLVLMCVCETVNVFAVKQWFPDMFFSVSLMFTVSLIVLVRWNFLSAIFPVVSAVLYCLLLQCLPGEDGITYSTYIIYIVGNSFVLLSWFLFKFIPKEKLFSKWYLTLIYPLVAFVLVIFGRTLTATCFEPDKFLDYLGSYVFADSLNIVFAIIALLILRRFDGMLEDQKSYLKRVAVEAEEAKKPKEEVWRGYTELDEEELKKLHADEGDGISMYDEYPPDSR